MCICSITHSMRMYVCMYVYVYVFHHSLSRAFVLQHVGTLRALLSSKIEAESAWHCYRKVIAEFTSAIKNRTPGMGRPATKPEQLETGMQWKSGAGVRSVSPRTNASVTFGVSRGRKELASDLKEKASTRNPSS